MKCVSAVLAALSLIALATLGCWAVEIAQIEDAVSQFHERLAQLEFIHDFARSAALVQETGHRLAALEEIVGTLEGVTSPASGSIATPIGLIAWAQKAFVDPQLLASIRPSTQDEFSATVDSFETYLILAHEQAQAARAQIRADQNPSTAIRAAFSFLSTALGTPEDPLSLGGLRLAVAFLPSEILLITTKQFLGDAVESAPNQALVFLTSGEHFAPAVTITKSVWISTSPEEKGLAHIVGSSNRPALIARNSARLELSSLTVRGGYTGVALQDDAVCSMSDCHVMYNEYAGLSLSDRAQVMIAESYIRNNERYGIVATGSSVVVLQDADVSLNVSIVAPEIGAGIAMFDETQLSVQTSHLVGNRGHGVLLGGSSAALLSESSIAYSRYIGLHLRELAHATVTSCSFSINGISDISVYAKACPQGVRDAWEPMLDFTGTLVGSGNSAGTTESGWRICLEDTKIPAGFFQQ